MSGAAMEVEGFDTPEQAILAHAIARYAAVRADAEDAATRLRRAAEAVGRVEGGAALVIVAELVAAA